MAESLASTHRDAKIKREALQRLKSLFSTKLTDKMIPSHKMKGVIFIHVHIVEIRC